LQALANNQTMGETSVSKVPHIERAYGGMGLTGECAYLWALFLRNEADMEDDQIMYSVWQSMVEQLAPKLGKPVPASVHYAELEQAIERYAK
jgi:hypothetical protein